MGSSRTRFSSSCHLPPMIRNKAYTIGAQCFHPSSLMVFGTSIACQVEDVRKLHVLHQSDDNVCRSLRLTKTTIFVYDVAAQRVSCRFTPGLGGNWKPFVRLLPHMKATTTSADTSNSTYPSVMYNLVVLRVADTERTLMHSACDEVLLLLLLL